MATYLASDVHLRLDRPERGRRFARFLRSLSSADELILGGDLCDFWFAARQCRGGDPSRCDGLMALKRRAEEGGKTTVLLGNHDTWLGPYYRRTFDADLAEEPLDIVRQGLRIRIVHGHRLGARSAWKAAMEGRAFLAGFSMLPDAVADRLALALERSNVRKLKATDARHRAMYRDYADASAAEIDLLAVGHIHVPWDDASRSPRVVVLGGWHSRASYLRIDETGAHQVIGQDGDLRAAPAQAGP